jgi:hypothetical protein
MSLSDSALSGFKPSQPFKSKESPTNAPQKACLVHPDKLVFPNAQNAPASSAQQPCHKPITRFVSSQLCGPICNAGVRDMPMPRATVPETSIHEHRHALATPNKIWRAGERRRAAPSDDSLCTKQADKPLFRARITRASHKAHYCRASTRSENVSHLHGIIVDQLAFGSSIASQSRMERGWSVLLTVNLAATLPFNDAGSSRCNRG